MDDDLKSAAETLKDLPSDRKYTPSAPKRYRSKKPLFYLLIIVLLIFTGYGIKRFIVDRPKPPAQATPSEQTALIETLRDVPETTALEAFTSTPLRLSFSFPKTWVVTETDNGIRVESPDFQYAALQQGEVTGNFRVYIRKGARDVDGTHIGRGVAIKDSDKLIYSQPAPGQRTETLLSSFGYNSADIFSFFLIAGNFQLAPGDTLGPNYGKEPDTYIVAGGYSSKGLTDDLSMNSMDPLTYNTTNAYKQAYAIIQSLQLK